jgi:ADP-dependent NAD(P)H-hydrate dehydratase / NAD(P)H-hydrate epimerase
MKLFTAAQIRACDAFTIHASGISSLDLMERAAASCTDWLVSNLPKESLFVVLCGTGNNGGDGFAIARMLHRNGYGVKSFLVRFSPVLSPDCEINLDKLKEIDPALVEEVPAETFITDIPEHIVIIDAIFGTGLNRPVEGWMANFIQHINELPNKKIAIDIPSGLPADNVPTEEAAIIKADDTLSFQFWKRSFLHPETGKYVGNVHLLDIRLDETFIRSTHTNYQVIDNPVIRKHFRKRDKFSNKGTHGTALFVGGSYGMMGAICLATKAAYRAGAGKVRAVVPQEGYHVFQTLVPEALCITNGEKFILRVKDWSGADAIGIGPGLGKDEKTIEAVARLLEQCKEPLVIDADALNIIAGKPELLNDIPAGSILTPHPKEFERLFGETVNSMMRVEHARTQAMKYNIVIVLKDRYTTVITPEGECWYNSTGNAGLATSGTGDVLAGMITALVAQKYDSVSAAMIAVYIHGLAADIALENQSMESMIASDVIDNIGRAFKTLA